MASKIGAIDEGTHHATTALGKRQRTAHKSDASGYAELAEAARDINEEVTTTTTTHETRHSCAESTLPAATWTEICAANLHRNASNGVGVEAVAVDTADCAENTARKTRTNVTTQKQHVGTAHHSSRVRWLVCQRVVGGC